jgi:hypothetical protein
MFAPCKSPVKVQPEILVIFFLGVLHVSYMDWGGGGGGKLSSGGECDMDQLGSVSFHSPFLNQFWIASTLVCSLCEAWLNHCAWLLLQYHRQRLLW